MRTCIFLLLISTFSFAQVKDQGVVKYIESIKLDIKLDGKNSEFAEMMPTSQDHNKFLYFTKNETLLTNKGVNDEMEINGGNESNQIKMVFKAPVSTIYQNLSDKSFFHETEIMGKEFLIVDKMLDIKWQITGEQKMILGYPCQKAVMQDTSQNVVAWFTPKIPVSVGPNDLNGLPGLILAAEYPKLKRTVIADQVNDFPKDFVFEKPEKGKKVSREEFKKTREEKMKEMGVSGGGGTRIIINREVKN